MAEEWDDERKVLRRRCKDDGELYHEFRFKIEGGDCFVPLCNLSGSEQGRLILDLLITKAREVSMQRLTLLLVESLVVSFDKSNFAAVLTALAKEEFQTVVSLPQYRVPDVLDGTSDHCKLKPLDYLAPWRLAVIEYVA